MGAPNPSELPVSGGDPFQAHRSTDLPHLNRIARRVLYGLVSNEKLAIFNSQTQCQRSALFSLLFPKMGNCCFGFKQRMLQRLQILPVLLIIRIFLPHRRIKDFRVVVVGSAGVGKSSLVHRWVRGTFRDAYLPTIENTFRQLMGHNRRMGVLQITDTAGSQRYPGLKRLAIARGHAFILVYSVTRKETLEELKPVYELIREIKGENLHKFPIVLVGNRSDESPRELTLRDGIACAQEWNCTFMETSAKEDINIQELFCMLLNHRKKHTTCLQKKSWITKAIEKLLEKYGDL